MLDDIIINDLVTIPGSELQYTASRSSGPGGQHVNKTDSRIQVRWNIPTTSALSDFLKRRVMIALSTRLTDGGDLLLASDSNRSQRRNKEDVTQRLAALVRAALVPPKPRRKTKPTRASRQRRLDDKKRRSAVKKQRGNNFD